MPPERFWVINKNAEHSQNYQHCNVIMEITEIKYRLFSKHFFQRTQQHGISKKALGNDEFI